MNQFPKSNAVTSSHVPSMSLFAQLLASERLIVRVDKSLQTAAFAPEQRILFLPSWSGFDEASWLLFVAHEVGHALYTPADALTSHPEWQRLVKAHGTSIVRNVTNVFEDIRIERLVREKYRGLSGIFGRGYHSLVNRDFFGFAPVDLTADVWASKNVLDRINLYAKVGALLRLSLSSSQEIAWYNRALRLNTYEEVLALVEEVIDTLNDEQKAQASKPQSGQLQGAPTQGQSSSQPTQGQPNQPSQGAQSSQSSQDSPNGESPNGENGENGQPSSQDDQDGASSSPSQDAQSSQGQPSSQPSQDGQDAQESAPSAGNATGSNPFEVASQQAAEQMLSASAQHTYINESVVLPTKTDFLHYNDVRIEEMLSKWEAPADVRALLQQVLVQQRREQSSILASMIAAFRANQAAWQSRRVQVSKSGTIDTAKLAQYKLVDDLFLRRQSLPEAQNHGFVIHVDWSGSMEGKMATVLWQVLHLIWFAESIKVPVSVYGFSNSGENTTAWHAYRATTKGRTTTGRLLELYRSNAPASVKQDAQTFLLALTMRFSGLASVFQHSGSSTTWPAHVTEHVRQLAPRSVLPVVQSVHALMGGMSHDIQKATFFHPMVSLGGTPLYHALFASVDTVRAFRQTHRIEQCVSVWLTDGDDTDDLHVEDLSVEHPSASPYYYGHGLSNRRGAPNYTLIDPRSGRQFVTVEGRMLATLFDLHRTLTGATVVCVDITSTPLHSLRRVLSKSDLSVVANQVSQDDGPTYYGRRRRPRGYVKPKTLVQNRKRVILPQSNGTFTDTGLLLVSRKQYPQIGCDAYLVSHPDWWKNADTGAQSITSAASDVLSRSNAVVDEVESLMTEEEREDAKLSAPVRLKAALLEQHATIAMRRFADLLVPYMAAGREDASVR